MKLHATALLFHCLLITVYRSFIALLISSHHQRLDEVLLIFFVWWYTVLQFSGNAYCEDAVCDAARPMKATIN